jgi:probable F420-dependent oxidoreductase
MLVDGGLMGTLSEVPARAKALEAAGYDGLMTAETSHDPFLPLALAAEHTERIELMTSIAVAFARSPMLLANIGHDLNAASQGRFILGLGSQIRPHITKRFSMPWSHPAARMRELILAMHAIWDTWYEHKKLDFRGEFYTHTLMTPFFVPTDTEHGAPRVFLAAVGPRMTEVAGEVADGLICHAFTTERYLRQVTLPALERGLAKAGKSRGDFAITCPVFVVTGADEEAYVRSRQLVTQQIAFYGSTPAYRGVLEAHGWGEMQSELNTMSVAEKPEQIAAGVKARFGDVLDRVAAGYLIASPEQERELLEAFKRA